MKLLYTKATTATYLMFSSTLSFQTNFHPLNFVRIDVYAFIFFKAKIRKREHMDGQTECEKD